MDALRGVVRASVKGGDRRMVPVEAVRTLTVLYCVRRAKARFSSGCESRPAAFAPAGSNRGSRGGNEAAEASGVEGHFVTWRVCRP